MNTEQLKSKILDLLVKGRLTAKWRESHKDIESAEALLEKIRSEKEKRLNNGLIAKGKKPGAKVEIKEVSESDKPFEIPKSWKWVHIEDITVSVGNKSNQIQTKEILLRGEIPVISQGQGFIDGYSNEADKAITEIPLIMFGDHTRNVKYIDFPFIVGADGTKLMKPILCCEKFIYYLVLYAAKNLRSRGYARHYTLLRNELFPLPPLEEQKELARIAETLFAMADSAADSCSSLEDLGRKAKSKVLDLLVKGGLTAKWRAEHKDTESAEALLEKIRSEKEKRLNNGLIAKGKKPGAKVEIKEVSESDKPFEIPKSWKWVHIEDITVSVGNKSNQIQTKEILLRGEIPVISQGQGFIDGYSNEADKAITEIPLIMFGDHTRNVKYIDFPFIVGADGTKLMKPILCCEKFIYYLVLYAAKNLRSRGYARHYTLLRNELFPLPPLEEQKEISRIAEILLRKIDSLSETENSPVGEAE